MMNKLPFLCLCLLTACTPKIQLETPAEGITINMNVVVDHKIEVSMDDKSRAMIKNKDKNADKQVSQLKSHSK